MGGYAQTDLSQTHSLTLPDLTPTVFSAGITVMWHHTQQSTDLINLSLTLPFQYSIPSYVSKNQSIFSQAVSPIYWCVILRLLYYGPYFLGISHACSLYI